jgi:hypothetical protein
MQFMHAFRKPIKCINVELIIGDYSTKKITNALIRPFQTITITCQIYKANGAATSEERKKKEKEGSAAFYVHQSRQFIRSETCA